MKHTAQKLAQEIRARLAEILRERVGDPRLEGVSLVEVRVAPDASFARVYWASLGDAAAAAQALEKAKPYIRRCLAGELDVRGVVLLGHPTYYPRFGFGPAVEHGVTPPQDWGPEYFMLRRLAAWQVLGPAAGAFRYAPAFERLD